MYMYMFTQPSSLSGGDDGGLPLSSENGNIGHLINDAMEDIIAPISAPSKTTPTSRIQSRSKKPSNNKNKMKKKKVAASSQSKPKMEIHVSGDNSIVMDFNSDTDEDDDDDDILRDLMSHHRSRRSASNGSGGEDKRLRDSLSPSSSSSTTFAAGKSMKQSGSDYGSIFSESDEDFCFVDAPTITKVVCVYIYTVYYAFQLTEVCIELHILYVHCTHVIGSWSQATGQMSS